MEINPMGEYRAVWGEGPVWDRGRLTYVDIESHKVVSLDPVTGSELVLDVGERVGMVVPRENGGLVIAGDHGFSFLDDKTGELTPISDPEPEKSDNRFNDGKCAPDGNLIAGTISLVKKTGDADLYRLSPDLSVEKVFGPVTNSNGLAWSSDGRTLYYIDTPTKIVRAFDYLDGNLTNGREAFSTAEFESSPDGMTIDEHGNLWIAFCHGGMVLCYDPALGKVLEKVELPCLETTSCTFGGEDLSDLYVTTGIHKTEVEDLAGRLLRVSGLGVRGVAAHRFAG